MRGLTLRRFSWKVSSRTEGLGLVMWFGRRRGLEILVGRSCEWVILDVQAGSTRLLYFRRVGCPLPYQLGSSGEGGGGLAVCK